MLGSKLMMDADEGYRFFFITMHKSEARSKSGKEQVAIYQKQVLSKAFTLQLTMSKTSFEIECMIRLEFRTDLLRFINAKLISVYWTSFATSSHCHGKCWSSAYLLKIIVKGLFCHKSKLFEHHWSEICSIQGMQHSTSIHVKLASVSQSGKIMLPLHALRIMVNVLLTWKYINNHVSM